MLPFNMLRERYEKPLIPELENKYHPENKVLSKNEFHILGDNFLDKNMIPKRYENLTSKDVIKFINEKLAPSFLPFDMDLFRLDSEKQPRKIYHIHEGKKKVYVFWPNSASEIDEKRLILKGKIIIYLVDFDFKSGLEIDGNLEHYFTSEEQVLEWNLEELLPIIYISENELLQLCSTLYMSYHFYDILGR